MAKILCIDTATGSCSVAVSIDGKLLCSEKVDDDYKHSEFLNLLIQECLKTCNLEFKDLKAVALSSGPGSYTSLRVGTATAKAICFALNIPLISIETLFALAHQMRIERPGADFYIPMIDARRMEVYTQTFDANLEILSDVESIILDEHSYLDNRHNNVVFGGDGANKFRDLRISKNWEFFDVKCLAENMIAIADVYYKKKLFVSTLNFSPLYLKKPNITQSKREPFQ